MVDHVECFETKKQIDTFVEGENTRDLSIHIVGWNATKGVSAGISKCSQCGAPRERTYTARSGCDLLEGGRVEVLAGRSADRKGTERDASIGLNSDHHVWAIEAVVIGEGSYPHLMSL